MKPNEGTLDRVIRVVLGAGIIAGGFFVKGTAAVVMWVLGGILLATGAVGICGIYMLFGINTCPVGKK